MPTPMLSVFPGLHERAPAAGRVGSFGVGFDGEIRASGGPTVLMERQAQGGESIVEWIDYVVIMIGLEGMVKESFVRWKR